MGPMLDDSTTEIVALGIYLAILLGIGVASARQIKSATDYTLAGRQVGWFCWPRLAPRCWAQVLQ